MRLFRALGLAATVVAFGFIAGGSALASPPGGEPPPPPLVWQTDRVAVMAPTLDTSTRIKAEFTIKCVYVAPPGYHIEGFEWHGPTNDYPGTPFTKGTLPIISGADNHIATGRVDMPGT